MKDWTPQRVIESLRKQFEKKDNYHPELKIAKTVDEGSNLTNIERQVHVWKEIKKL